MITSVKPNELDVDSGIYYIANILSGEVEKYFGVDTHSLQKVMMVQWATRGCVFNSKEDARILLDKVNAVIATEVK